MASTKLSAAQRKYRLDRLEGLLRVPGPSGDGYPEAFGSLWEVAREVLEIHRPGAAQRIEREWDARCGFMTEEAPAPGPTGRGLPAASKGRRHTR